MRRWALLAIVAWVALWPLAQRGLVSAYDINPWKLGGWAMYTVPTPPVLVALFKDENGQPVLLNEDELGKRLAQSLLEFRTKRHAIGDWLLPDDIARDVLSNRSDIPRMHIVVQRSYLASATGVIEVDRDVYSYDRSGLVAHRGNR